MNEVSIHIHLPSSEPLRAVLAETIPAMAQRERFARHADLPGVIVDHERNLMWSEATVGGSMTWEKANAAASAVTLGGFTDWRLPTIQELLSLVDYERHDPAINTDFFQCESNWYWTSSPWAPSPAVHAWVVNFSYGDSLGNHRTYYARVRAVRSVVGAGQ